MRLRYGSWREDSRSVSKIINDKIIGGRNRGRRGVTFFSPRLRTRSRYRTGDLRLSVAKGVIEQPLILELALRYWALGWSIVPLVNVMSLRVALPLFSRIKP